MTRTPLVASALAVTALVAVATAIGLVCGTPVKAVTQRVRMKDAVNADIGDRLCVPGIDFSASERTIVVALSGRCPISKASEAFLRLLAAAAARASIPIYCLVGDVSEGLPRLAQNVKVVNGSGRDVGLYWVPSVTLVDRNGKIAALRIGGVLEAGANEVIHSLLTESPDTTSGFQSVTEADVRNGYTASVSPQVVDPSEDENAADGVNPHFGSAVNIPASELLVRAPYELDRERPVVVDCREIGSLRCQSAMAALRFHGFRSVAGLGLRKLGSSPTCRLALQDYLKVLR